MSTVVKHSQVLFKEESLGLTIFIYTLLYIFQIFLAQFPECFEFVLFEFGGIGEEIVPHFILVEILNGQIGRFGKPGDFVQPFVRFFVRCLGEARAVVDGHEAAGRKLTVDAVERRRSAEAVPVVDEIIEHEQV